MKILQTSFRCILVSWLVQQSISTKFVNTSKSDLKENFNVEILLAKNICFETKGNKYGRIIVLNQASLTITKIKLVHVSGKISSQPKSWAFWGSGSSLDTLITDRSNQIICPNIPIGKGGWYILPGYNAMSPELVFDNLNIKINYGDELRLWFGEDLQQYTSDDNQGKCCADVYAEYPDVDECQEKSDDCSQICINTIGSYKCSCNDGYRLLSDERTCEDVDECQEKLVDCSQIGINTIGSYKRSCNDGYHLLSDERTCEDVDECHDKDKDICSQICSNTIGSYKCSCHDGYRLLPDERFCEDVDECHDKKDICSQICSNTIGSYKCSCRKGFHHLADQRSCEEDYYEVHVRPPPEWFQDDL